MAAALNALAYDVVVERTTQQPTKEAQKKLRPAHHLNDHETLFCNPWPSYRYFHSPFLELLLIIILLFRPQTASQWASVSIPLFNVQRLTPYNVLVSYDIDLWLSSSLSLEHLRQVQMPRTKRLLKSPFKHLHGELT